MPGEEDLAGSFRRVRTKPERNVSLGLRIDGLEDIGQTVALGVGSALRKAGPFRIDRAVGR